MTPSKEPPVSAEQRIAELESLRNAQAKQLGVMAQERDAAHKRITELEAQVVALVEGAKRAQAWSLDALIAYAHGKPIRMPTDLWEFIGDLPSFAAARDARIRREALEEAAVVVDDLVCEPCHGAAAKLRALADASKEQKPYPLFPLNTSGRCDRGEHAACVRSSCECPCHAAASKEDERCHADRDGDCSWSGCPQNRDGEPRKTGRHCPLDTSKEDG